MTFLPLLLAAALSAGNAEFDRTAYDGTMSIVRARLEKRLLNEGPAKGGLKTRMLAEPSKYDTLAKAKAVSERDYRELLDKEYRDELEAASRRLGAELTVDGGVSGSDGYKAAFERRFAEERQAACEEQAKNITARVRPPEADFGRKDEQTIRAELEAAVIGQQRATVFEENKRYISDQIVEPILASAKKELERQREYLKRTRCDSYAPSALEKELAANLERNVRDRKGKGSGQALEWGVFPVVVESGAKEIAEKRTLERVAHAIDDVEMKVDVSSLGSQIAGDRERHRKLADSEQLFRSIFADLLTRQALEKVVADAPAAERAEFKEFVTARAGEASLGKAVEARVKRELLPRVREVREEIAAADAAKIWPGLMDGTWYPEPSLADDICARSDYSKLVKTWRNSPELAMLAQASEGRVLIEETERLADAKVAKSFDLARSAINAQNAVLDKVVPRVMDEAKGLKGGWFSEKPDQTKIVSMLTTEVESGWRETRDTVLWGGDEKPANAEVQHRELFPSVRKRIELLAKTILEEVQKPEPEKQPEEPKPEDPPEEKPPEVTPPEEPPPEEMLFTISVKKSGNRLEAKILQGKSAIFERDCPANKSDFRTLSTSLIDKLVEVLGVK